jgi:hypothetical protein
MTSFLFIRQQRVHSRLIWLHRPVLSFLAARAQGQCPRVRPGLSLETTEPLSLSNFFLKPLFPMPVYNGQLRRTLVPQAVFAQTV